MEATNPSYVGDKKSSHKKPKNDLQLHKPCRDAKQALSKIGTRLLASLGSKGKTRNSLAWLRNAGSYFAETYCKWHCACICAILSFSLKSTRIIALFTDPLTFWFGPQSAQVHACLSSSNDAERAEFQNVANVCENWRTTC